MKKNTALRLDAQGAVTTLLASFLCIFIGLVIGFVVLLVLGWVTLAQDGSALTFAEMLKKTWASGFKPILCGGFFKTANTMGMGVRAEILQAAPLVMTGLSVAFAFKTGLFNIGAAGQYTVGAYFALYSALMLKLPWWACLVMATLQIFNIQECCQHQCDRILENHSQQEEHSIVLQCAKEALRICRIAKQFYVVSKANKGLCAVAVPFEQAQAQRRNQGVEHEYHIDNQRGK